MLFIVKYYFVSGANSFQYVAEFCSEFSSCNVFWGVYVTEDTYPEPWACEVAWPVPFITLVLPPGTHSLLGER